MTLSQSTFLNFGIHNWLQASINRISGYTTKPARREVTIHDLLTHTSGYCYPGSGGEDINAIYAKLKVVSGVPSHISTLKDEMQNIALVPLAHEPGEKFTYGLSSDILGYLVEVISGQSLDDFFPDPDLQSAWNVRYVLPNSGGEKGKTDESVYCRCKRKWYSEIHK